MFRVVKESLTGKQRPKGGGHHLGSIWDKFQAVETAHAQAGAEAGACLACSRSNSKWSVWLEHMSRGRAVGESVRKATGWNRVMYSPVGHWKHIASGF